MNTCLHQIISPVLRDERESKCKIILNKCKIFKIAMK
jgi:hypothetical protein